MTTERQRAANRANAQRSTGPRTKRGKQASRLNARVHGLATSIKSEPDADAEISLLADAIVVEAGRPELRPFALRIAEAELTIRRVRAARERLAKFPPPDRYQMITVETANAKTFSRALDIANRKQLPTMEAFADLVIKMGWRPGASDEVERAVGAPLTDRTEETLDRYERRAMSRRKFAIRDFDAALAELGGGAM